MPRLAEDMQDQADQPLVDSEDKVGQTSAVLCCAVILTLHPALEYLVSFVRFRAIAFQRGFIFQ